jgi:DNA-binding NarL/FixJ family response regulator
VKGHRQILVIQAPTNLSGPEIASKVSVSVNTVNTDVRNIDAKLQAPRSGGGHTLICQASRRMEGFGPGAPGWGIGEAQS